MKAVSVVTLVILLMINISFTASSESGIKEITLSEKDIISFEDKLEENEVFYKRLQGFEKDNDNHFYYLAGHFVYIYKVDRDTGKLIKTISSKGQGPGELVSPIGMKVKNGKIAVVDIGYGGIKIFDLEGNCLKEFRCISSSGIFNLSPIDISCIDINNRDEIYLENTDEESNTMLSVFDMQGKLLRQLIPLNAKREENVKQWVLNTTFDFKLDNEGNVVILYNKKGLLKKYDKNGQLIWERDLNQDLPQKEKNKEKLEIINTKRRFQVTMRVNFVGLCINDNDDIFVGGAKGGLFYNKSGKPQFMLKQPSNRGFGGMCIWEKNKLITPQKTYNLGNKLESKEK